MRLCPRCYCASVASYKYDKSQCRCVACGLEWKDNGNKDALQEILEAVRGIQLDRLEEICQAEREERLVVLPCKVGDMVWIVSDDEAVECTLTDSLMYKAKNYNLEISRHTDGICKGKQTVFLTKKQAEVALKGVKHE